MQNNWQLFWSQGQFLTPQHFQQQDLFHAGQLARNWQLSHPYPWGIAQLEIWEEGLHSLDFEVTQCELVTREGQRLRIGQGQDEAPNAQLPKRRFDGLMDPGGKPLSVYIGFPRYREGQSNIQDADASTAAGELPPRYTVSVRKSMDLFRADRPGAADVTFLQSNLVLFFDREEAFTRLRDVTDAIKIAEIVPAPKGVGGQLSSAYIPPCLRIGSSPALVHRLKELRDLVTAKMLEFEVAKRKRPDPVRLLMIQTIARYAPVLHHLLEVGWAHPEGTYALLRQMVAEFSAFSEQVSTLGALAGRQGADAGDLQAYDHLRIAECFDRALDRIQMLINGLEVGSDAGIAFIWSTPYFTASLPAAIFEVPNTQYYIMFEHALQGEDLRRVLYDRGGKVCALDEMEQLRVSALFGLKMELVVDLPPNLPRGKNRTYFRVDPNSPVWKRAAKKQNLAIFCELNEKETSIKLFAVRDA